MGRLIKKRKIQFASQPIIRSNRGIRHKDKKRPLLKKLSKTDLRDFRFYCYFCIKTNDIDSNSQQSAETNTVANFYLDFCLSSKPLKIKEVIRIFQNLKKLCQQAISRELLTKSVKGCVFYWN